MKKILIIAAVLAVIAAAGGGGWWYAADRGYIPGKPNSPRPENFKRALDQYLATQTPGFPNRPCIGIGYSSPQGKGFPDMRFDFTPVGFRAVLNAANPSHASIKGQLELLAKQGYFQSVAVADGAEFTMTWKGFAATNASGCFYLAGPEREAKVIGFEKRRVENNIEIYEVTARPQFIKIEPWAQSPEFRERFPGHNAKQLDPDPATYELARSETGFTVLGERGRQSAAISRNGDEVEMAAKLAGTVTPDRVKKAVEAYFTRSNGVPATLCLRLPSMGEVDEILPNPGIQAIYGGTGPASAKTSYTVYNNAGLPRYQMENKLRGYELMRRLESLGLAQSEILNVAEFNGMPVLGGVRFTPSDEFLARLSKGYPGCYAVGTLQADEVVSVDQFSNATIRPRFVVRLTLKIADEEAGKVVKKFGNLARISEMGSVISGSLRYTNGELQVEGANVNMPTFAPDLSDVNLPVISVTPSRTQPPMGTQGGNYRSPTPSSPSVAAVAPDMRSALVQGSDIYAIGVYEGALQRGAIRGPQQQPEGTVNVTIRNVNKPIVLYLSAYGPVNWVISASPGTRLVRIITSGYHPQRVTTNATSGMEVLRVPYVSISSNTGPTDLSRATTQQFGKAPVSSQYSYTGRNFEVGVR